MQLAAPLTLPNSQTARPMPENNSLKRSSIIRCVGLSKTFSISRGRTSTVLKNIDLTMQAGEYVILYGPSGSGKSTLLHLIAGLEPPTQGHILIRNRDLASFSRSELAQFHRTKIGMVFQQFNLITTLTVLENVSLPQVFLRVPIKTRRKRATEILRILGLENFTDSYPTELSGGEQQRVAIARSLINNPLIMLIDEPTGNLDSSSAEDVMRLIKDLNEKSRRTILLVTHNPDYVYFPHRVLYLKDGTITKQVINRPLEMPQRVPKKESMGLSEEELKNL